MGTSTIRSRYRSDYGSHLLSDRAVKLVRNICIEENFNTATGIVDDDFVLIMLKYLVIMFFQCHDGRSLEQNRKIARQKMQEALDKHFNGENSIKALERQKVIQQNKERKEAARRRMEEKRALKAAAAALKNEEDENNLTDEGSGIGMVYR